MKDPNEGARLLRLAMELERLTHEEAEDRADLGSGVVSRYLGGQRLPERLPAIRLFEEFGIPVNAWDYPPLGKGEAASGKMPPGRQYVQPIRPDAKRAAT